MQLTHDQIFYYAGFGGCDSWAHLRVFQEGGALPVVIVGELDDNPGTSVTNFAEELAELIALGFFPEGREFVFIEFYAGQIDQWREDRTPSYSMTTFDLSAAGRGLGAPTWSYKEPEVVEQLVGRKLPEWPAHGSYTQATAVGKTPA